MLETQFKGSSCISLKPGTFLETDHCNCVAALSEPRQVRQHLGLPKRIGESVVGEVKYAAGQCSFSHLCSTINTQIRL